MKMKVLKYIRNHDKLMEFLSLIYCFFMFNTIKGRKGVDVSYKGAFVKSLKVLNYGKNNEVYVGEGSRIYNGTLKIYGNNNTIYISNDCELNELDIWISDGGHISIGNNTYITGKTHIACTEGKKVNIGARCLFSSDITIRTGDSHSILDISGKRINMADDVSIGNHVWIGNKVVMLKGTAIGDDSVVGTCSLVTKRFDSNCIVGGNPAQVIRRNILWTHEII